MQQQLLQNLVIRDNKYSRNNYSELDTLSNTIGELHNCKSNCIITTSGMQAIYLAVIAISIHTNWNKFNLLYGNELYCDTPKLFANFSSTFNNLILKCIDPNDAVNQFKNYSGQHNVLFIETCSNPNGIMFNFSQIKELKKISKSLIVIADNTWLTNYILNPIELGADIVVTSLTKYYSAGKAIGGAIIFKNSSLYKTAFNYNKMTGNHICPLTALIIIDKIASTGQRMMVASEKTIKILNRLKTNNKILKINHPYLSGHVMPIYPSVFTIESYCSKSKMLFTLRQANSHIKHETSFGSEYSKTDPWPKENSSNNITITTWRISIGFADNEDAVYESLINIINSL